MEEELEMDESAYEMYHQAQTSRNILKSTEQVITEVLSIVNY